MHLQVAVLLRQPPQIDDWFLAANLSCRVTLNTGACGNRVKAWRAERAKDMVLDRLRIEDPKSEPGATTTLPATSLRDATRSPGSLTPGNREASANRRSSMDLRPCAGSSARRSRTASAPGRCADPPANSAFPRWPRQTVQPGGGDQIGPMPTRLQMQHALGRLVMRATRSLASIAPSFRAEPCCEPVSDWLCSIAHRR